MKILNSDGKPLLLNEQESKIANLNQRHVNALGYQIDITTMTTIMKKITEQKFFKIAPALYLPLRVGEGAWSSDLLTYRSYETGDDFEKGVVNTGGGNGRLAAVDVGIDSVSVKVIDWAKSIGWTLMDLQKASRSGNWDLVTKKESSRKRNWDLGIQKIAFLGSAADAAVKGLLTQTGVTNNLTEITTPISTMTAAQLSTFLETILNTYRVNCNRTAWPTHFILPESDYLGLAAPSDPNFPLKSKMALLMETFKIMTGNENFQILPLAYADQAYNTLGVQRYVLLNYDEESLRMDIPVDYTSTLANSLDNFAFQNVGYGQFTGVQAYRPQELMYFSY